MSNTNWELVRQVASEAIEALPKKDGFLMASNYTHPEWCVPCLMSRVGNKARELAEMYSALLEQERENVKETTRRA